MNPTSPSPSSPDSDLLDRFVAAGLECLEREEAGAEAHGERASPPAVEEVPASSARWWRGALVAAGVLVTGWILWQASRSADRAADPTPAPAAPRPMQDPDRALSPVVVLRGNAAIEALEAAPVALRAFEIGAAGLERLARLGGTQYLEIVEAEVEGAALTESVAAITSLRGLYIESSGDGEVDLAPLGRLPVLERLSLHAMNLDTDVLAPLARYPALTRLDVRGCTLHPTALEAIGAIPGLRELALTPSPALPVSTLAAFPEPARIRALLLNQRARLAPIEKGPILILEDVTNAASPYSLIGLVGFTGLERLSLRPAREMQGGELRHLSGLTRLRDLDLSGCFEVDDAALDPLPDSIERLDLSATAWAKPLPAVLSRLRVLTASRCWALTDEAIAALSGCESLRSLGLRYSPGLTSASAEALAGFDLVELDLAGAGWADEEACGRLAAMPHLERLCLSSLEAVQLSMGAGGPVSIGVRHAMTARAVARLLTAPGLTELEIEQLGDLGRVVPDGAPGAALATIAVGGTRLAGRDGEVLFDVEQNRAAWRALLPGVEVVERAGEARVPLVDPRWATAWATLWVERRS